jgi:hypothetical protein
MKILFHNPDNGITGNFMLHLWMFLLQARTPPPHEVILLELAWSESYDPAATRRAMSKIVAAPVPYKISHLIARLCFRGTKGLARVVQGNDRKPKRDSSHHPRFLHEMARVGGGRSTSGL